MAIAPPWLCDLLVSLATDEQIKTKQRSQAAEERARLAEQRRQQRALNQLKGHTTLEDCLEESIARLGTDIYNWEGHNFVERGSRFEGCCPNHQSVSGRSFHVNLNTWEWYCFGCGLGGHAVEYRQFVNTGTIQARGKDFVDIVRELAADAGVEFPEPNRSEFIARLLAQAKNLSKHFHKGFGQYCHQNVAVYLPKTIKYDPKTPLPHKSDYEGKQPPIIKFSKGQRLEVIAKLRSLGWQFVLDRSFMGNW